MSELCLRAEGLSKRFFVVSSRRTALRTLRALIRGESLRRELWVLRNLTFEVQRGEKLAIVGSNGSGKTTLLRVLTGIYQMTSGRLTTRHSPSALFDCTIGFNPELAVWENVFLFGAVHGMSRKSLVPKLDEILRVAEVDQLRFVPLKDLSVGQVQRLAITIFFQTPNDFLIFDEVLGNVDLGFRRQSETLFQCLRSPLKTVIMTSHDATFLRKHCQRALWLDGGRLRMAGPLEEVLGEYERSYGRNGETPARERDIPEWVQAARRSFRRS
jgi:ABC-type polysaccharide/polyol phosphate transport system ATPase subunit